MLVGDDGIGTAPLAAGVTDHAGIAVRGHGLGIAPGPFVVGIDGEGQQRRQRRCLRRAHDQRRNACAIRSAHQHIAIDGVAARVVRPQRGIEQGHERRIGIVHLPGAHQFDGLGQRHALARPDLLQGGVQVATPARQAAAERELGTQRHLVVQRTETPGERLRPCLRERQVPAGLQQLRAGMDFVLQEDRRLRGRVVAQGADGVDALQRLRMLPGGQLQPEQCVELARAIIVAIDRDHVARERGHRAVDAISLQAGGDTDLLRLREGSRRKQGQQPSQSTTHRCTGNGAGGQF